MSVKKCGWQPSVAGLLATNEVLIRERNVATGHANQLADELIQCVTLIRTLWMFMKTGENEHQINLILQRLEAAQTVLLRVGAVSETGELLCPFCHARFNAESDLAAHDILLHEGLSRMESVHGTVCQWGSQCVCNIDHYRQVAEGL